MSAPSLIFYVPKVNEDNKVVLSSKDGWSNYVSYDKIYADADLTIYYTNHKGQTYCASAYKQTKP
jgi:hypothetical protein